MRSLADLRSDTITQPTPGMRAALAAADVGDDVLGDDPTVNQLEQRSAELLGQPAAVYVPSGTMANQIAIRATTEPGQELIIDYSTHSYNYEAGGAAALSGVSFHILKTPRGIFTPAQVAAAIRPDDVHFPVSRMVIIENTNNRGGGSVWSVAEVADVAAVTRANNLHLHLDGARLLNACVARGCRPTDYTAHVDSVSLCFSKGLGAPVGSVLAGPDAFIKRARRFRKMFGGGMRQAGIIAAAALYALDHNVERLAEDHANARKLAEALAELPGIRLDPASVETNIVIFDVEPPIASPAALVAQLEQRGVRMLAISPTRVRAVTHLDVSAAQIDQAISVIREIVKRAGG